MDLGIAYIECINCGEIHSPNESINPKRHKEYKFKDKITGDDIEIPLPYSILIQHKKMPKRILRELFLKETPSPTDKAIKASISVIDSIVEINQDGKHIVVKCPSCGAIQYEVRL